MQSARAIRREDRRAGRVHTWVVTLVSIATLTVGGVVDAPAASAVTGCKVWPNTDFRAYAQCSGGRGQMRAGAACVINRTGMFIRSAYGLWVGPGKVSVADCGFPFQTIDRRDGRPVVWWETRG